ncbi:MAG: discoidin domain-containing protein [Bacteroidaceae bacterium]|nr:discoidin domain-containing protein [Bacteroidaceae bacterium]
MKKLYSLFILLFSLLLGTTTAFAQNEKTIQVNIDKGQWTVCNAGKTWATQWSTYDQDPLVTVTSHPASGGGTAATDARGVSFYGNNNMNYYDGSNIKFFNSPYNDGGGHKYEVTVAAGWYIQSLSFNFKSESANGISVILNDQEEVYSAGPDDVQSISFENADNDEDIFTVPFIVLRAEENTFAQTSEFTVVVRKLSEATTALQELQNTLAQYEGYAGSFIVGTQPGQYGEAEVNAFESAIIEAHESENNPDLDAMEDAEKAAFYRTLAENIKSTYAAVVASKVPMTLTDGYYRIKSAMAFYTTETVTDPETLEETTTTVYHDKYLSTSQNGETTSAVWNTPDDVTTYCPALFYVTNKDGFFDIRSMATDGRFNNDKPVTLTVNGTNLMALDPVVTTEEGETYVNIRQSTVEANSGQIYLHCGGHGSGTGVSGTLTLWYPTYENGTPAASEWVFVPVSEEEANAIIEAYGPIKEQEMLIYNFKTTMADAKEKMAIARDIVINVESEKPLVTDNSQFSSPWTESSEGSIENLIDDNASTYWHSAWSGGSVPNGTHYLQVEINDADISTVANAAIKITRRPVANDHVTVWGVFGTNEAEAEKDACEDLGQINTPFGTNTETIVSDVFPTKGYKYLRFYIDGTTTGRGYGHVSEFQIYPAEVYQSPTAQSIVMGSVFTNLENVVNDLNGVEPEDAELEQYRTLKAAYDAFMALFVDPTDLRNTLADLEGMASAVVVGTNPGFWSATDGAGAFRTLYDEAVAYDAAGAYNAEKSQSYIDNLNTQVENIYASANKIQTGKWYRIRFGSEEEFEEYGWDKVAGNGTTSTDSETGNVTVVNEPLFGKYLTVSYLDGAVDNANVVVDQVEAEEFGLNSNLFFDAKEDIYESQDLDLFRFIAVGDSAYMLQNKGTNLFLKAAGTSGAVRLSVHPTLFNVRAIGYGQNLIASESLTGRENSYLHAQVSGNMLVTWNVANEGNDKAGWRSSFYIEEAEDVASDFEGTEFQVPIVYGSLNSFCFPMEVTAEEGQMWSVSGVDVANNSVTLVKIEKAIAGRPFIFINGETADYNAEEEAEMLKFKHNCSIDVLEPQTSGLLKGTFANTAIDRGDLYISGNGFVASKVSKTDVMTGPVTISPNRAYIAAGEAFSTSEEIEIVWDAESVDGIQTALQNVSKSGAVYTIDGRLVSRKATLNDLSGFGKGLYIINGVKVIVK